MFIQYSFYYGLAFSRQLFNLPAGIIFYNIVILEKQVPFCFSSFFGVITGWLLLHEPLKPSLIVGGLFIITGIYLVNRNFTA